MYLNRVLKNDSTMRILHIISSLDPKAGGPPMIAFRLAAGQAGLGHTVNLLSYAVPGGEARIEDALKGVPGRSAVQVHYLSPPSRLEWCLPGKGLAEIRRLIEACDVVHLHGVWEPLLRVAAKEAYRLRRPYFILLNGMLDPWSLSQKFLKKQLALMFGYRRMLNRAAGLHLGNLDEKRLIAPLGLRSPGVIIPNGVFLEELEPLPSPGCFRAKFPQLVNRPYILFLSRLHYKKGLDYLADAFALVARKQPDVILVVAGPDGGERQNFQNSVAASNLQSRVHVVGPLYGPDKYAAMVDAACFCLPSRQEGFSMAIIEALACGTPAVISDACHFPEVAEVGAGHVVPLNPANVADALLAVLSDPAAKERMGTAGQNLVRSRLTWPKIAEQSLAAYQEHLAAARNRNKAAE